MREIKFREWDKDSKLMDNVVRLEVDDSGHFDTAEGYGNVYHNFELMQYTGLHDKNGREIYEGDIVHVWDNGVAVVIFDESLGCGQWICKFKPAFPDFEEWSAPLYGWLDGNVDGSVFEILGNVYETQELMEVAKHDAD